MRNELNAITPRLRRYARALVSGSSCACETSDALVQATLMRAIGARAIGMSTELPIRLFATVTQMHRDLAPAGCSELPARDTQRASSSAEPLPAPSDCLAAALLQLPLDEREALLLVTLEGFDHAVAARILRISRPVLFDRLTRARNALSRHLAAPAPGTMSPLGSAAASTRVPYLRLVVG